MAPEKTNQPERRVKKSKGNGADRRKEDRNGKERSANGTAFSNLSAPQLLKALRAFDQGDFSVADTVNARQVLKALRAYNSGNFHVRLPEDLTGIAGEISVTFNEIVARHERMLKEFSKVNKAVGKDGRVSQRVELENAESGWAEHAEFFNSVIDDLIQPMDDVSQVIEAISKGDFSRPMSLDVEGRPLKGEYLRVARLTNNMLGLLDRFSNEVIRVAREVGTEGKLGGQAEVKGVTGTWRDLTDSVNTMADNLTTQVRDIAKVATGVAQGDLSKTITTEAKGEVAELKDTVNNMIENLRTFSKEVTTVALQVGTEGILGGQANVEGVAGVWADLTRNVNVMANNLTDQVRNIAEVATAVANGDLTKKITVDAKGEVLKLKSTLNTMVDQLSNFSDEVTRVAREVGTEGELGGQAEVKGVAGAWRDLTNNVNTMATNLTSQVREIARVTTAVANGDLSQKITIDAKGEVAKLKDTINVMVESLRTFSDEVTRVAKEVGSEGILGGQAKVEGVSGTWKGLTDSVNTMATNLTNQVREIATVTTAVANGDLTQKITAEVKGEVLRLKETINDMIDQLSIFAGEVTRVATEVGTDGKLGGQADVKGVSGTWKALTDSVNTMASNLTSQVRDIATVASAVANGDLTKQITVEVKGEILKLKLTINTMVDQLTGFSEEVTRVAREVGTEGKLGGQAEVKGVSGTWRDLTDNVNTMADNLTTQVRDIAKVATGVAQGDLSKNITTEAKGEVAELKDTVNNMIENLRTFSREVTTVALQVGTEGILGGQANVEGVAGVWADLTRNVNTMANNLTDQVRNIAEVSTAVANGDLTKKITVDAKGEVLQLKNTINTMVDQLGNFSDEVTRVAREVGTDGELGGQAEVKGVAGAWRDLTNNVNMMATNLTDQVRNVTEVTTAVANGDLSRTITVDAKGEVATLKETINSMVERLRIFADEVTRVAKEVGTDGELGGQANVEGVAGVWADLTKNVNTMANNLTDQVRDIATITSAVASGDLTKKITVQVKGEIAKLKETINQMVDQLRSFAGEVTRVATEVGTEGKLGGQADVKDVSGTWKALTESVNTMATNLTDQVRDIAAVTTAVANGDLTKTISVQVKGEVLELKKTINTMVEKLNVFSKEVTRVAKEVGTEGKLGGQATVEEVRGIWKDLTDNVNNMATNLTEQVRDISKVATAIAEGDLTQEISVDAQGEVLELKNTINSMVKVLIAFSGEVTTVAREVGSEGKLGGQADVPGAQGTWKDLTNNVNELASNLTNQVRAIAEVATAVTEGDMTRSITVEVRGEIADLKNNLNQMIGTLSEVSQTNAEQDWLKSNLAKLSRLMQGKKDLQNFGSELISELCQLLESRHGVFYIVEKKDDDSVISLLSSYGYKERKHLSNRFKFGEGLVGQVAVEKQKIVLSEVPADYIKISSALGESTPREITIIPILFENELNGVIELASFKKTSVNEQTFLDQLTSSIGISINSLVANVRTEVLLKESQALSEELQSQQEELKDSNEKLEEQAATLKQSEEKLKSQQEELQQTNEELQDKARMLSEQKAEVELKNTEVEQAKGALEQKAEQLALTSKYKSEFLANMSHELRTPLNSLLILSEMLKKNKDKTFNEKQLESIGTIHNSGTELLALINEILDLAKIESGTMAIDISDVLFKSLEDWAKQGFSQLAANKNINFELIRAKGLPGAVRTDTKRLQQILKNLLSNAFKFTDKGGVTLDMSIAKGGWDPEHVILRQAKQVIAFAVKDTGIGVSSEKQKIIFEAFQQADGTTSRKYGGTGLGLSISREIARLLGGEIRLESVPDQGSTFTFYVPQTYIVPSNEGPRSSGNMHPGYLQMEALPNFVPQIALKREPDEIMDEATLLTVSEVADDREAIKEGDRVILIIEDDVKFAQILLDHTREQGFKGLVALRGDTGLAVARKFKPDAIVLDIHLPGINGWKVMDLLKHDQNMRHIPVQILSGDDARKRSLKSGAISFLKKPVDEKKLKSIFSDIKGFISKGPRRLLIVEDDEVQRKSLIELIGNGDVTVTAVGRGKEALKQLKQNHFDCMVLDLVLPDTSGFALIEEIKKIPKLINLPIIIYTGRVLSKEDETKLASVAETIIVKDVGSPERLLDETALFLHRVEGNLPESKRKLLQQVHDVDPALRHRKVLVVDDDMRNIFAMNSILEGHEMKVLHAESGQEALDSLKKNGDIELVLMDIMMPGMDGYDTTRAIREMKAFKKLPVIAVTAKAMKGDREKCIQAGASDYITKPVNTEQLLSLLRVWLYK